MGEVTLPENNFPVSNALQCKLCERQVVFQTRRHLYSHYSNIHYKERLQSFICPDKNNGCTICGKEFSSTGGVIYHIGVAHNRLEDFIPSNFHVPKRTCEFPMKSNRAARMAESPVLEDNPHYTSCEDMPTIIGVNHGRDDYHFPQAFQEKRDVEESPIAVDDHCDTSCEDVPTIISVETVTTEETESDPDPEEETADDGRVKTSKL